MSDLKGKKVAGLVETEYIPEEIQRYYDFFTEYGVEVDFIKWTILLY